MKLEEIQKCALDLPDSDRAVLAAELLVSLPAVLVDEDDGVAEATRRSKELENDPSMGCSWEEIKRSLGR
ncbi:addiction module protein [Luteolibacter pohnpeiensis]|uniref:Addiction module protein n=1 Tax=Luteolibacter pohnpeiensis TaxID=454153 RepID=A0A934SG98_9BACT|nr:addiction module protein [Luteolibacter pohnpeiensis]